MSRFIFALLILWPTAAMAQSRETPGRDLLAFPIGLTGEPPVFGTQAAAGLWNPATLLLAPGYRWRIAAAAMSAPTDISVSAQLLSVATVWQQTTFALTLLRAGVSDLLRTESDPQTIGDAIAYQTTVISLGAARRISPHLVVGTALRNRNGRLDEVNRSVTSFDAGVIVDHLTPFDLRLGASTFLWSPHSGGRERASYLAGADLRLIGADTARTVRAGYALQRTEQQATEHVLFASGRWGLWEVRGGPVRTEIFGETNLRLRLGVTLHYAGYAIGVAREESAGGIAPTYQFSLTSLLK